MINKLFLKTCQKQKSNVQFEKIKKFFEHTPWGNRMCGIVGIFHHERPAAQDTYLALLAIEHRGKESVGVATSLRGRTYSAHGMGRVTENEKIICALPGYMSVGHTRYGTAGSNDPSNVQPIKGTFRGHTFYIAHNGNLVNTKTLRKKTRSGKNASDTRVVAKLIEMSEKLQFEDALIDALRELQGAYCFVILFNDTVYAIRDPYGFHPLQLGRYPEGAGWVIASESCAFPHIGASLVGDIPPGEMVSINKKGFEFRQWSTFRSLKIDLFEYIYFLRPDSIIEGIEVGLARERMGWDLATAHPLPTDLIIPAPDSANQSAQGYIKHMLSMECVDPRNFDMWAMFRPHTSGVGRSFIEPEEKRSQTRAKKINMRPRTVKGKRVTIVDDSLVRGNSFKDFQKWLRDAGALSVSAVVASPPYLHEDPYGTDTYRERNEIIAQKYHGDLKKVARACGLEYLGYLDLDVTVNAILDSAGNHTNLKKSNFYTGPFNGIYPAGLGDLKF